MVVTAHKIWKRREYEQVTGGLVTGDWGQQLEKRGSPVSVFLGTLYFITVCGRSEFGILRIANPVL